jgi:hypothetical protein
MEDPTRRCENDTGNGTRLLGVPGPKGTPLFLGLIDTHSLASPRWHMRRSSTVTIFPFNIIHNQFALTTFLYCPPNGRRSMKRLQIRRSVVNTSY